jgi:hypothetical protein
MTPALRGFLQILQRVAVVPALYLLVASSLACASPRKIDDYHWDKVDRVVAIGDLHGDYDNYLRVLGIAGIINARGQWVAGETHLVQLGDIPDRGADTLKIIAHLKTLAAQAQRKGGMVHTLLGNHEAMNTYGDLRYVTAGEFAAFAGRDSKQWRDRYYENVLADIKAREPERFASLPDDFRQAWDASHPLGWVEHQRGWNPRWNPKAEYFQWALQDEVAVQVNDMVFVHGGISGAYCRNSLASLTEQAREALRKGDPATPSILTDENGPLWYRGLAGVEPRASEETVSAILEQHGARHIVVGHTPTQGAIWPRYNSQVIQVDSGISKAYGGHVAYLEATAAGLRAGYAAGKLDLPRDDSGRLAYLRQVVALQPDNAGLRVQLAALERTADGNGQAPDTHAESVRNGAGPGPATATATMPTCGISP